MANSAPIDEFLHAIETASIPACGARSAWPAGLLAEMEAASA